MSPRRAGALPLLLRLDAEAQQPLNQQIYQGLRSAILNGRLHVGARLPSSRELAMDLAISRNTVLNAYERLADEGYLQGRSGGGTRVSTELPEDILRARLPLVRQSPKRSRRRISDRALRIAEVPIRPRFLQMPRPIRAFRLGACALDEFPTELWGRLVRRQWSRSRNGTSALDYGEVAGYAPLRAAIATYLQSARGVTCEADQVFIVNGSQQALDLSSRVLLDPGDLAWLEDPGYDGIHGAIVSAGARGVAVPVDREGIQVARGIRQAPDARVAYVTPSHQFPLGITMSLARRLELLRWASKSGAWIVEDDYDSELRYANRPLPALQGLDAHDSVIYTGTFSKIVFPALRLGYLVVPRSLVDTFAKVRLLTDVHMPTLTQAVMADFIAEGHFERHIRRMRILYRERQQALLDAARRYLDGMLNVVPADGGMHLLGWLPKGIDDREASRCAAAEGIDALPVSCFSRLHQRRGALILGYSGLTPGAINQGAKRLAVALERLIRR
jgi:GntR family transcriptional regulator / MocR family aminotransferase